MDTVNYLCVRNNTWMRTVDEIVDEMESANVVETVSDADAVIRAKVVSPDDMGIQIFFNDDYKDVYYWDYHGDEDIRDFISETHSEIVKMKKE